jgi:hypothetical protein
MSSVGTMLKVAIWKTTSNSILAFVGKLTFHSGIIRIMLKVSTTDQSMFKLPDIMKLSTKFVPTTAAVDVLTTSTVFCVTMAAEPSYI